MTHYRHYQHLYMNIQTIHSYTDNNRKIILGQHDMAAIMDPTHPRHGQLLLR